jgi:hypothetical protein
MKRLSPVLLAALAFAACQDHTTTPEAVPESDQPLVEILDGAHGPGGEVGNPNFFFLPPIVRGFPEVNGTFNPDLEPVVEICEWDEGAGDPCVNVVETFTTDPEANPHIKIKRKHEFYMVIWKTRRSGLEAGKIYRIRVIVSGFELGHADVRVVHNFWQWLKVLIHERDEFIPVKERSRGALPIPFRIEQGAISYAASGGEFTGCAEGQQCGEEVVTLEEDPETGAVTNPEEETVTANNDQGDAQAGIFIPAGALLIGGNGGEGAAPARGPARAAAQENGSEQVVITVRRIEIPEERERCLPIDLPQFEGCYQVEIFPDTVEIAPEHFIDIGVCVDHSMLSPEQEDLLQLHRFDPDDPEAQVEALPLVEAGFLECSDFVTLNEERSWLRNFAQSTWQRVASVFGPAPLHASAAVRHEGLGGRSGEASDFGWALPAKWALYEGANQNAGTNQPVPVDPAVIVTDVNDDPVEGATMTFEVQLGGGAVVPMMVTTGPDGIGRVDSWTLGSSEGENQLSVTADGLSGFPTTEGPLPTTSINFFAAASDFCGFGPENSLVSVLVTHGADCETPGEVRSAAEALFLVEPGGTIDIADDATPHLVQRLVVDQPVTFTSSDEGRPTIDADGAAFSFIVNAVPSGEVRFENLKFVGAGTYNIWAQGTYDQVVVDNSRFEVSGTSGVTAQGSTEEGANVSVQASTFVSAPPNLGTVGTFAINTDFDVLNSSFSGFSFSGIQYQTGATGRVEGNTVTDCGLNGCIRTVNLNGATVEIIDNDVSVNFGSSARWGIVGDDGPMVIQDNTVTGIGDGGDSTSRASYPFEAGIRIGQVALGSPGPGNATTLSGNSVTNAAVGIQTDEAQVAGSDNFITTVHTGIEDLNSSTGFINETDVTDYHVPMDGEGSLDLTCNWWGQIGGPTNVPEHIDDTVFTPFADGPIAGPGTGNCGGGGEAPPAGFSTRPRTAPMLRGPATAGELEGPTVIINGKAVKLPVPQ